MTNQEKKQAVFRPCDHQTMHLQLDNGQEKECDILTLMELGGKEYIALLPQERESEGEAYIYGFSLKDGQPCLRSLTDQEELAAALDAFDEWYEQAEVGPVPVDVFSGFLGAGKTTLIKKLLAEVYQGEKIALIENEFGDVNIDSGFLQDSGVAIREMNAGCICCSLVGDFTTALAKVVDELHPDRIIIEPSGVGKLSEIIRAVEQAAGDKLELSSASVVVDAGKAKMYMKNFGEFFNDQVEHAAAIILSHTDRISPEKLAAAVELLREHNPLAAIVTTPWEQLDGAQLMEAIHHTDSLEQELAELAARSQGELHWSDDEQDEECCHEHHHHEHDEHECCCHHHKHHDEHDEHCGCWEHHHQDDEEQEEHPGCERHHHPDCDDSNEHCGCEHHHHEHEEHDGECCHGHHHHEHDEHDEECCHEHHHHEHEEHDGECRHEHHHHEHDEHGGECYHEHHHHGHGHHHADEVFVSWGVETTKEFSQEELNELLTQLTDEARFGLVLRAKGIVCAGGADWLHFDYVPGEPEVRSGSPAVIGRLCVIGSHINEAALAALFGVNGR